MGSSPSTSGSAPSPEFLAVFRQHADATGAMTFARFMELALYAPGVGYYRRDRTRVGYAPGTDFYTASTSGPLFGELVSAACVKLLGPRDPAGYTFVEIGAEPGKNVLAGVTHPFGATCTVRLADAPLALTGPCVVFSNELFDAQPCTRSVFRRGRWHELGVRLVDNHLVEIELSSADALALLSASTGHPPVNTSSQPSHTPTPEGYRFDRPLAAAALADTIARQPWTGLFVAFDYGKTLQDLAEDCPGGTLRAYHRHTQSNELLAQPGEQDLTCHVCWDWLSETLQRNGFASPALQSQESFFIHHAADFIAATTTAEATRLSQRKLSLLQLLHPAHLGQKFQVLHALR